MFERILVPTDGSRAVERAVEVGLRMASTDGATVHALFVVETREEWDFAVERREREGERAVEAVEGRGDELGVPVIKAFRYGLPHEEIVDYADAHGIDLVVVGSHGRTGFGRFVHAGSVAEHVVRRSRVPVLVVRGEPRSSE
ncbi:universal stress protein [Halegenticoccus soli]|uniref:universal stress protein n=1 Tax=Halegenticoccus soli TaxID=1985678 RepID=UPI000C6E54B1|nr:universal stress protein [Halegenticoccus soli]